MTWPSVPVSTTALDQNTDSLVTARAALLDAVQKINQVFLSRGIANGIAALGSDGFIIESQLNPVALLTLVRTVDGDGSGLDADLLDGLNADVFVRRDGSASGYILTDDVLVPEGFLIARTATLGNARTRPLVLRALTGAAISAGFGVELAFSLENPSAFTRDAVTLSAEWIDPTNASEDAALVERYYVAGSAIETKRRVGTWEQWKESGVPATLPASGFKQIYMTGAGLSVRDSAGAVVVLGATGTSDHGTLSGLGDQADHLYAVTIDGSRVMTGDFQLGANVINLTDRTTPADPAASHIYLYSKAQQLYFKAGSVETLITAGGGGADHNALTNLAVGDVHTQYLLRQPSADVVINNSAADRNFVIKGTAAANLFNLDAGVNAVGINMVPTSLAQGRLQVADSGSNICIAGLAASGIALTASTATGTGLQVVVSSTGAGVAVARTASGAFTTPLVSIADNGATGYQALFISQLATAEAIRVQIAGDVVFTVGGTALVINEQGVNYDVRMEGENQANLFVLDASLDSISIYGTTTAGRFNVDGGTLDAIYGKAITSGKYGVSGVGIGSGANGVLGVADSSVAIKAQITTGVGIWALRSGPSANGDTATCEIASTDITDPGPLMILRYGGVSDVLQFREPGGTPGWQLRSDGSVVFPELGGDTTAPSGGGIALWAKGGELYYRSTVAGIVGPLGTGGGGGGGGGWTDDGTTVRLTTSTDKLVVGANSSSFTEKLIAIGGLAVDGNTTICVPGQTQVAGRLQAITGTSWSSGGVTLSGTITVLGTCAAGILMVIVARVTTGITGPATWTLATRSSGGIITPIATGIANTMNTTVGDTQTKKLIELNETVDIVAVPASGSFTAGKVKFHGLLLTGVAPTS